MKNYPQFYMSYINYDVLNSETDDNMQFKGNT